MMRLAGLFIFLATIAMNAQDNYNLVIGTYTNECDSKGIYVYDFNAATAQFKLKNNTDKVSNPSYLTVSPDKKFIYSVNEDGDKSTVSAFKYGVSNGSLGFLNKKDSKGADPCYIINDEKNVIVANYSGGTITVLGKKADGSLGDIKQVVNHSGSSVNKERQEKAHPHMVYFSPDRKYVFSNDLGTDKIYIYTYNPDGGDKTLVLKETTPTVAGSGPRHLVFNPNGIFFYVLHELNGTIVSYSYDKGVAGRLQEISLVPEGFNGVNGGADIHFSNDGKFLYATNRGDANTISVFRVHANGMLNMVQQISTQGVSPRNFVIDPKDNFLLVANQKSNNIVIFKRDKTTGMLEDTTKRIEVCAPVCLVFTTNK
ncbi:6-phosphogluconolactonase [Flavobacterium album]|uniref:6-phosphogluconolactonase n=1 Tax=Flavobacterium album TaxID=2175091 RepID=A0A2S1QZZ1_9FLAO|nr:lactonase family protein [Flavobacterium album]AWH85935.1 6-phosphogluconolactonase [Flavobacterium album]